MLFRPLNRLFIRRLESRWAGLPAGDRRERLGAFEGHLSVVVNLVLSLIKLAGGLLTGSLALIGDAFHSASDCLTSLVVIFGFHFSNKDPDKEHPFGHGRAELVSTLIIAILLLIAGAELGRAAVERLLAPQPLDPVPAWLIAVVAATILIKEGLADFAFQLGRRIGSETLAADAWHHRLDSISTALVVAALLAENAALPRMDGAVGLAVALLVAWSGFTIARRSVTRLLGQAPEAELLEQLEDAARAVSGVEGVHEVVVHDYGLHLHISLHIEVAQSHSLLEAHAIADEVERRVATAVPSQVIVHVDPIDLDDPLRNAMAALVRAELPRLKAVQFHDLRLEDLRPAQAGRRVDLELALVWAPGTPEFDCRRESQALEARLKESFAELRRVHIDCRRRFH
jgi:cation diffusion facilitator family transporter